MPEFHEVHSNSEMAYLEGCHGNFVRFYVKTKVKTKYLSSFVDHQEQDTAPKVEALRFHVAVYFHPGNYKKSKNMHKNYTWKSVAFIKSKL